MLEKFDNFWRNCKFETRNSNSETNSNFEFRVSNFPYAWRKQQELSLLEMRFSPEKQRPTFHM